MGGILTYTFQIENAGACPLTEADALVLSDTFDPRLGGITVTYNGQPWAANTNYTYNEATGAFASAAGFITLPAADFTQGADGAWSVTPSCATLSISGTVQPAN